MDTKIEIKEEDPLSLDVALQNETEFFTKIVRMKMDNDVKLLDDDFVESFKTEEVKSGTPFPDFCAQKERKSSTKYLGKKSETATSSNNCKIDMKTENEEQTLTYDFYSQKEEEFLPMDLVKNNKNYNSDHEMDSKLEIKEGPWLLDIEASSVCNDSKDESFPPAKSSRLQTKALSGDSNAKFPFPFVEDSGRDTNFYNVNDYPVCGTEESSDKKIPELSQPELSSKYNDGEVMYCTPFYLKQNKLINRCERPHLSNICKVSQSSASKIQNLTHQSNKLHHYKTCDKSSTPPSSLKRHNLIHKGKKLYQCKICDKSFTKLSNLNRHNLIHEGKKPHQCKTCDKSFIELSHLKIHNLIHEGKKPHQCKICNKKFTQISHLKMHNLVHEGKKPHQCKICDKRFTDLANFKRHSLIHEGKKPYQCKSCDKHFTRLSCLKRHNLIHEGKKPYQCEICYKSFTQVSHLKTHNLVHECIKSHLCTACNKSFTHLRSLRVHNLIHEGKKL